MDARQYRTVRLALTCAFLLLAILGTCRRAFATTNDPLSVYWHYIGSDAFLNNSYAWEPQATGPDDYADKSKLWAHFDYTNAAGQGLFYRSVGVANNGSGGPTINSTAEYFWINPEAFNGPSAEATAYVKFVGVQALDFPSTSGSWTGQRVPGYFFPNAPVPAWAYNGGCQSGAYTYYELFAARKRSGWSGGWEWLYFQGDKTTTRTVLATGVADAYPVSEAWGETANGGTFPNARPGGAPSVYIVTHAPYGQAAPGVPNDTGEAIVAGSGTAAESQNRAIVDAAFRRYAPDWQRSQDGTTTWVYPSVDFEDPAEGGEPPLPPDLGFADDFLDAIKGWLSGLVASLSTQLEGLLWPVEAVKDFFAAGTAP